MSLVNSRTPKAHPDEQHQGTYSIKPVSVFMFEEGAQIDSFTPIEIGELLRFYGVDTVSELPPQAPLLEGPALADVPQRPVSVPPDVCAWTPKVVRKRGQEASLPRVVDACVILIDGLSEAHKESLFKRLATQLGYDIQ
nr:MAG: hypothetical protein [Bacteriophage sp.]